jgi:hypothetical protein
VGAAGLDTIAVGHYLNADGLTDLAMLPGPTIVSLSSELLVLSGNGSGGFRPLRRQPLPGAHFDIEAADLNHDGSSDLVLPTHLTGRMIAFTACEP